MFKRIGIYGSVAVLGLQWLIGCAGAPTVEHLSASETAQEDAIPKVQFNEFIIGAGDAIEVKVWRHPDLSGVYQVQPNGVISFPLVEPIRVSGMGLLDFQKLIAEKFSEYVVDPHISVQVRAPRSHKVFVLGEVKSPGVFVLDQPLTVVEAIASAGGFTLDASDQSVLLVRKSIEGPQQAVSLNVAKALNGKDLQQNVSLQRGDIIYVPPSYLAQADRFFRHLSTALAPLLAIEQGIALYPAVKDAITEGGKVTTSVSPVVVISP